MSTGIPPSIEGMITGAGIFVSGYGFNSLISWWCGDPEAAEEGPKGPVCGCTHGLQTHDRKTGECKAAVKKEKFAKGGEKSGHQWMDCACQQYVGPQPLTEYYAPDITE